MFAKDMGHEGPKIVQSVSVQETGGSSDAPIKVQSANVFVIASEWANHNQGDA